MVIQVGEIEAYKQIGHNKRAARHKRIFWAAPATAPPAAAGQPKTMEQSQSTKHKAKAKRSERAPDPNERLKPRTCVVGLELGAKQK